MIEYQQRFDGSWYIDVAELREALEGEDGGRIRALVLINPNNPTGSYVKASEREAIVRLCHDHEVAIIADEVFYDYDLEPFDGNARLAGETGTLTFALDGFSKTLAAPHAKVGWIQVSGPAAEVDEAKRRLDVVADDYLPMSEIIAKQIPAMLAPQPRRPRACESACKPTSQPCIPCWMMTSRAWSACCVPKADGMCFCACPACLTRTNWCCP